MIRQRDSVLRYTYIFFIVASRNVLSTADLEIRTL